MAGRGPLPQKTRRRTNAPTIPTTNLPARGRRGRSPICPYDLGTAGKDWWSWAWHLPQAMAWSVGDLYLLGRRARLEDDLAAISTVDEFDLGDLLDLDEAATAVNARVREIVQRLAAHTSGALQIQREMREIDDRIGLTPKGMAALRWTIVPEAKVDEGDAGDDSGLVSSLAARRAAMTRSA